jgi:DNA-binding transcriptional LysR family regulator
MDLASLHAFLTIAEEGHVTRAATRLHLTQPAVSTQLRKLEGTLGQRLFHRTAKGMVLTEAGLVFRTHATDALKRLDAGKEALDRLVGLEQGGLSLGGGATATTYLLPPLFGAFHAQHPAIRLHVREMGSRAVMKAVHAGELDLGVVTLPETPATGDSRVILEPWLMDELRLIVPAGHPLSKQNAFRWVDLEHERLVLFEAGTAVRAIIDGHLSRSGVTADIVMELRSIESIKQMVAQGIGAGFVSQYALPASNPGLRCADGAVSRQLGLATPQGRVPSPAGAAFLTQMRQLSAMH